MIASRTAVILAVALLAATPALAQMGGGGGSGGGGGGGRHGGGGGSKKSQPTATVPTSAPIPQQTPVNEVEIIGVVRSVDAQNGRVTIAYEASDSLNLPAGTQPFDVAKTDLLKSATVGSKVRFQLESHQISAIRPF